MNTSSQPRLNLTPPDIQRSQQLQTLCMERIRQVGAVTFAQFMEWCLYEPELGYYESVHNPIGRRGDFVTSPQVAADFAELVGEQFVQMWEILGKPAPFVLVEMGSGSGLLAQDLLTYLHEMHPVLWGCLTYFSVERSAQMRQRQRQNLPPSLEDGTWQVVESLDEIPGSIVGCIFSNELLDALPVHRLQIREGSLQEIYVTLAEDETGPALTESLGELSSPRLTEYFETVGIRLPSDQHPEGYRTEVNLAATEWIQSVAARLERGYLLTIDYGHPAHRYYHPNRSTGTLLCYRQHISLDSPYEWIGSQDITAHVDFTALQTFGQRVGLESLGLTQQSFFLVNLGLLERIATLPQVQGSQQPSQILQRRQALHTLMDPLGLGQFGVLVQCKGLSSPERRIRLRGLS